MNFKTLGTQIISNFDAPIRYAFGYGSGVIKQGAKNKKGMIDLIFGVTHPAHWHSLNIRQNPHHYSCVKRLGGGSISSIQDNYGGSIFYNPFVMIEGHRCKYGVVSIDSLVSDLTNWNTFYLAGRLQKPTVVIRDDARVYLANQNNLRNAVCIALLNLPQQFSEEDLFLEIAGLSYKGDFRMIFGENPRKVFNIVSNQMDEFRAMYKPIIDNIPLVNYISDTMLAQDTDNPAQRALMVSELPVKFLERVQNRYLEDSGAGKLDKSALASYPDLAKLVQKSLADTVRVPAITQALKGLVSAGTFRSLLYVKEKLGKRK